MNIRPVDLAEVRTDLVRRRDATPPATLAQALRAERLGMNSRDVAIRETTKLAMSDLFYVSGEMAQLARAAAPSLPNFALEPADCPTTIGLAYFDGGIGGPSSEFGNSHMKIHLVCWQALTHGVMLGFYADTESLVKYTFDSEVGVGHAITAGPIPQEIYLATVGLGFWTFGQEVEEPDLDMNSAFALCAPVLRATWLLMAQPLASVADVQYDRAARRRFARDHQEPPPVRVITLRRPASTGNGESDRGYHHQWIVRGHWRQQWYPSRQVNRPVWIAPHVKGPEGAPMLGGEKVYAWSR